MMRSRALDWIGAIRYLLDLPFCIVCCIEYDTIPRVALFSSFRLT